MRRLLVSLLAGSLLGIAACAGLEGSRDGAGGGDAVPLATSEASLPADSVVEVVDAVLPSVVNIRTRTSEAGAFGVVEGGSTGTGFVVAPEGIVVTNYHVVEGALQITVSTTATPPERYDAFVIGSDPLADIAVLKIDADDLPAVTLGSAGGLRLGQAVVAVGYALGLSGGPSVTSGVVSAVERAITVPDADCRECPDGERVFTDVIQTDAAINPGNSGGPLIDMAGRVVGINSAGSTDAENIGFAIPIETALPIIERARTEPDAAVAFLGVSTATLDEDIAAELGISVTVGAVVVDVTSGGPAERAGFEEGYVIVGFAGIEVTASDQLRDLVRERQPGETVTLRVVTPGGTIEIDVELGVNPVP